MGRNVLSKFSAHLMLCSSVAADEALRATQHAIQLLQAHLLPLTSRFSKKADLATFAKDAVRILKQKSKLKEI